MQNGSKRRDKKPESPLSTYSKKDLDDLLKQCHGDHRVYDAIRINVSRDVLFRLRADHERLATAASPDKEAVRTLITVSEQPYFVICTQIKGGRQTLYTKVWENQPIDTTVPI